MPASTASSIQTAELVSALRRIDARELRDHEVRRAQIELSAVRAANLLGDRTSAGAVAFALCNAGEALIAAALSSASLVRVSPSTGCAKSWDCWRLRPLRVRYLGVGGTLGFKLVPLLDCTESDHLAALVRVRCTRHCDGCATADRNCRGRTQPAIAERDRRRCRSTRCDNGDQRDCYLFAARIMCDSGADRLAVSAIAVAGGPLPAGVRRGSRVHRCGDDRMDDNLRHWIFRRPRSPDRRPYRGCPGRHPDNVALHACSCRTVCRAASARGALSEGAARLEEALAAGAVMAFEWDARTGLSHHSENAANFLATTRKRP